MGRPSTARSNPSINRPAIQPRSGGDPSGIDGPVRPRGSWRTDAASSAVTRPLRAFVGIEFALHGAPCGDQSDSTPPRRPRHHQQPALLGQADRPPAPLRLECSSSGGELTPIVQHGRGLFEADRTSTQIRGRLARIPIDHTPDASPGRPPWQSSPSDPRQPSLGSQVRWSEATAAPRRSAELASRFYHGTSVPLAVAPAGRPPRIVEAAPGAVNGRCRQGRAPSAYQRRGDPLLADRRPVRSVSGRRVVDCLAPRGLLVTRSSGVARGRRTHGTLAPSFTIATKSPTSRPTSSGLATVRRFKGLEREFAS